jgi:hypothetical protein
VHAEDVSLTETIDFRVAIGDKAMPHGFCLDSLAARYVQRRSVASPQVSTCSKMPRCFPP